MSEVNHDQHGSDSDKVGQSLFGNDKSKWIPYHTPCTSPTDETDKSSHRTCSITKGVGVPFSQSYCPSGVQLY